MATRTRRSALLGSEALSELAMLLGLGVVAAIGHVVLFLLLYVLPAVLGMFDAPPPPPDVIEISLVSLPQTDSSMAQMDTHVARAPTPQDLEAPDPVEDPGMADQGTPEPADTPNPSDLAFETPDAQETQGDPENTRQDTERDAERRRLLREALLNSAEGSADSQAGDPDSTSSERIDLGGQGVRNPEAARYIEKCKRILYENFNPLPQLRNHKPPYASYIVVRIDVDTGQVQSWSWAQRSGNASWDAAAERAVESVTRLPPPPASVKGLFAGGFKFEFTVDD